MRNHDKRIDICYVQLLSLVIENKALVARLHTATKDQSGGVDTSKKDCAGRSHSANKDKVGGEEAKQFTSMSSEVCKSFLDKLIKLVLLTYMDYGKRY